MPKCLAALQTFFTNVASKVNNADMLDRWTPGMETQINVSPEGGERVDGQKNVWADEVGNHWFNIRIPRQANSDPYFKDFDMPFSLSEKAESIGSTGWDWTNRRSRWFGYDFDALTGHAAGVGVSDEELLVVKEAAKQIPWVEVRKSTSGSGLHLYVFADEDGIPAENHDIHSAIGRAILGMMGEIAGFDFAMQVDQAGGNMWIWSRRATAENGGLSLIKPAETTLSLTDLPPNWRSHLDVVKKKRSKVRIEGVPEELLDPFEQLASARRIVPLDETHKRLIDELCRTGFSTVWVSDHHLLQTHTVAFKRIFEQGGITGIFETTSQGGDGGKPNCFAFPLPDGGWRLYRFGQGVGEAATWIQDGQGWTTCEFNVRPDLRSAALSVGGLEDPDKGGFVFDTLADAAKAIHALGQEFRVPEGMSKKATRLKRHKDGRLVVEVERPAGDEKPNGWLEKGAKKDKLTRVLNVQSDTKREDLSLIEFDNVLRCLTSQDGETWGWVKKSATTGEWVKAPKDDVRSILVGLGYSKPEAEQIIGTAAIRDWRIVNLPFQMEYPGNRQWNRGAAQLRYQPADLAEDEVPQHPHWDRILTHCGQDLDNALKHNEWALRSGIKTGAEYLRLWIACMFREPFEPLPYLFLFGPQNCGKSILHEALSLLMTKGVASGDRALTNTSDFNGEIANAVLVYIEETNVSKAADTAYNKIKDWVTGRMISIHAKRQQVYLQKNSTHWIQCANDRSHCPIYPGDTRITMAHVPPLSKDEEIPKSLLLSRLEEEAPYFLCTLMDLDMPESNSRLRIPVVETYQKQQAEDDNKDALQQFISERVHYAPGQAVEFKDFHAKFQAFLNESKIEESWSSIRVGRGLPELHQKGKRGSSGIFVGNVSWEPVEVDPQAIPLVCRDGKLVPERVEVC